MESEAMRNVEAYDLELYAINTGELYATHKRLANASLNDWARHVAMTILPRYCHEVEPVAAAGATIRIVAQALREYYQRHANEESEYEARERRRLAAKAP